MLVLFILKTPSPVTPRRCRLLISSYPLNKRCCARRGVSKSRIELNNNVKRKQAHNNSMKKKKKKNLVTVLNVVTLCACVAPLLCSLSHSRLLLKDIYIYMYTRVKFFFREERQAPGKPGSIVTHSQKKKSFIFPSPLHHHLQSAPPSSLTHRVISACSFYDSHI